MTATSTAGDQTRWSGATNAERQDPDRENSDTTVRAHTVQPQTTRAQTRQAQTGQPEPMTDQYGGCNGASGRGTSLRIGLVCPYSFEVAGGVQNHVLGLGGWLARAGHTVHLFGPGAPSAQMLAAVGLDASCFTSAGRAVPVRYNGSTARINFGPVAARRVRTWLADHDLDLVHIHEPITPSVALLALWAAEVPVLVTCHTATPGSRSMRLARRLAPATIARMGRPLAVSQVAAGVVRDHVGLAASVVGNGIGLPPTPFDLDRQQLRGERPLVVFIGRHDEPRKGFGTLLQAWPLVRASHPDAELAVIGAGGSLPARHHHQGITMLGALDDAGRDQWLARADVYVAPHTGRESFGVVLLEAMAAGTDVVASDLPAFAELLGHRSGRLGDLVTPRDPVALAEALNRALHPRIEPRRTAGRQRAAEFDWSVIGPQVLAHYRERLGCQHQSGRDQPIGRGQVLGHGHGGATATSRPTPLHSEHPAGAGHDPASPGRHAGRESAGTGHESAGTGHYTGQHG